MFRSRFRRTVALAGALAFVAVFVVGALGVSRAPTTPFDEATHLDYLFKISSGQVPQIDEPYGQVILSIQACDVPRPPAWASLEPCGSAHFDPKLAPFQGQSTATSYAPTYYAISAIPFRVCYAVTSLNPRTCARLVNVMWLSAAAAGFTVLVLLLGQGLLVALLVGTGVCLIPSVLVQGITFNPDAAVHACVAWLAVLALVLCRATWRWWVQLLTLAAAAAFSITLKETALVGAFLVFLLYAYVQLARMPLRARLVRLLWIAGTFLGVLVVVVLNQKFQIAWRGQGLSDFMNEAIKVPWDQVPALLSLCFYSALGPFNLLVWPPLGNAVLQQAVGLLAIVTWAMALQTHTPRLEGSGWLRLPTRRRAATSYAPLSVAVALLVPVLLTLVLWLQSGLAPVQPRYYMATAALLLALGAGSTKNRWVSWFAAACLTATSLLVVEALVTM